MKAERLSVPASNAGAKDNKRLLKRESQQQTPMDAQRGWDSRELGTLG